MLAFDQAHLIRALDECDDAALDRLPFGVVAMDRECKVLAYNAAEQRLAGLSRERVVGKDFFNEVAPCANNYLVAQRFLDEDALDAQLPYVFTLKMRPTRVTLRLLKAPAAQRMYLLVQPA